MVSLAVVTITEVGEGRFSFRKHVAQPDFKDREREEKEKASIQY